MLVRNRCDRAWGGKGQGRCERRRSDGLVTEGRLLLEDNGSHVGNISEVETVISNEVELCFIHRSIVLGAPRGQVAGRESERSTSTGCWKRTCVGAVAVSK